MSGSFSSQKRRKSSPADRKSLPARNSGDCEGEERFLTAKTPFGKLRTWPSTPRKN
jgi:hypothetical protein